MSELPFGIQLDASYGKVLCEPNWKWNRSELPFHDYDFWYVWGGVGEVTLNGVSRQVSRGACYLFRPGDVTVASHRPEKPLSVTYIHFSLKADCGLAALMGELPSVVRFDRHSDTSHEHDLDRFIHVMVTKQYGYEEEAAILLRLLLLSYDRRSRMGRGTETETKHALYRTMLEAASYVRQNPGGGHTIEKLAEKAGLSARYFALKFKELMGQTIESFLIDKKVERAEYLLQYQGMSVSEVAEALGYHSIYFFSRQFKQKTGMSPTACKRSGET
ncbi:AraC family transcriptional regulator [Paenibacillus hodogayensis]|uniref:AraC family transcriptional regulator n=1 Tax=Paenibacillus hodogayensis TaxID=279208 RepID=A0ABV5W3U0_9BACL